MCNMCTMYICFSVKVKEDVLWIKFQGIIAPSHPFSIKAGDYFGERKKKGRMQF